MKKWFKDKAGIAEDYVQSGISDEYRIGHDRIFGGPKTPITVKTNPYIGAPPTTKPVTLNQALGRIKHWYMHDRDHERFPANALQDALSAAELRDV